MLGIKQKFGCVHHPQSQGTVERANGTLKAKLDKILADSSGKLHWIDALPLVLMCMRSQTNRLTHLTPHEMLTGGPMPVPYLRGPYEGPPLEQLERELTSYLQHLTQIHKVIFQQVKGATEEREACISDELQRVRPGEWVYIKVFKRKWDQPWREGPFKVISVTPTALKVEDKKFWFHLNHCCRVDNPEGMADGSEGEGDTPHRRLDWKGKVTPPCRKVDVSEPSGRKAIPETGCQTMLKQANYIHIKNVKVDGILKGERPK